MSRNDIGGVSVAGESKDCGTAKGPMAGRARVSADGLAPAAGREGAPPSNTAPNSCNGVFFQPLRWGVDSLYLSYAGQLFEPVWTQLDDLKRKGMRPAATVPTAPGGCVTEAYGGLISSMNSPSSHALAIAASSRSSMSTSVSPSRRCSIARH